MHIPSLDASSRFIPNVKLYDPELQFVWPQSRPVIQNQITATAGHRECMHRWAMPSPGQPAVSYLSIGLLSTQISSPAAFALCSSCLLYRWLSKRKTMFGGNLVNVLSEQFGSVLQGTKQKLCYKRSYWTCLFCL